MARQPVKRARARSNALISKRIQVRGVCKEPGCNHQQKQYASGFSEYCSAHHKIQYEKKYAYKKERLNYCENRDGRLGFVCESIIRCDSQLEVDHIDGNSSHNHISNLQTLCCMCHRYKTFMGKDFQKIKKPAGKTDMIMTLDRFFE